MSDLRLDNLYLPSALWIGATAVIPFKEGYLAQLRLEPKYGEPITLGYQDKDKLHVPLNLVSHDGATDCRVKFKPYEHNYKVSPRDEDQARVLGQAKELLDAGYNFIAEAPTGWGKCLKIGEQILMYDGTFKKVEDVKIGDLIMGDDSTPRTVLSLGNGIDPTYKITTVKGESFYCNADHILCLKRTNDGTKKAGEIVEVTVKEYLTWSKTRKHIFKLYKPSRVDFGGNKPLEIDPYFLGVLLGDGGLTKQVVVTSPDKEIVDYFYSYVESLNMRVSTARKMDYVAVSPSKGEKNILISKLRELKLFGLKSGEKFIPNHYLTASYEERLQLIAGLIDTDGYLNVSCYDYISKSKQLAEGLVFLCNSVGLHSIAKDCRKTNTVTGKGGDYFRVTISGDIDKIPCKVERKKAKPRQQKKDVLVHGFNVEYVGEHEYYGFTITGNGRFLTKDFFVTHNTWLGCSLAVHLAQPTLIIIPKSDLIASWRKNLIDTLGVSPEDIGIVKGADVNYKNKRFVIALVQSVIREGKFEDDFYSTFGLVIWDEVHRMSADSFSKSCMLFNARHRLGLSATTYRGDGKMPVVEAHIGKVMVKGKSVPMQPKILVVKTGYKIPAYSLGGKKLFYSAGRMMQAYEDMGCNDSRNNYIIDFVLSSIKADRQGIVLMSDMIDKHLRKLHSLLLKRGVNADEIGYYTGGMSEASLQSNARKKVVLTTYQMCREGTDFPHWDTLVLCTPHSEVTQAIGRVMRKKEGKKQPVILDLLDDNNLLQGYFLSRRKNYLGVVASPQDIKMLN